MEALNAQGSCPVGDCERWMEAARFAYPKARAKEEVDKALDEAKARFYRADMAHHTNLQRRMARTT